MRVPDDAIIADDKLTKYLLVHRLWDDKSSFLERLGFTLENWTALGNAIRQLADSVDAMETGSNVYGTFFQVEGLLTGPKASRNVVLIWMRRAADQRFHFVTLKPRRARQ